MSEVLNAMIGQDESAGKVYTVIGNLYLKADGGKSVRTDYLEWVRGTSAADAEKNARDGLRQKEGFDRLCIVAVYAGMPENIQGSSGR